MQNDYNYCFQDEVVKWPGSVRDSRIFLNSSISRMLRKRKISPCEKIFVEGRATVLVFFLSDPAYSLPPFLKKEFFGGGRNERENSDVIQM